MKTETLKKSNAMKKIAFAILLIVSLGLKAQFGLSYNSLIPTDKTNYKNWPMMGNSLGHSITFDAYVASSPKTNTNLRLSAGYVTSKIDETQVKDYANAQKIAYDYYKLDKSSNNGFLLTAGVMQPLILKGGKNFQVSLNADLGYYFANKQAVNYYIGQGQLSKKIESNGGAFVWKPSLSFYTSLFKRTILSLNTGYSNIGGMSVGLGTVVYLDKAKDKGPPPYILIIKDPWLPK